MTLDHSPLRALFFDIDGTLANTDDQVIRRFTRLLHPIRFLFQGQNPQPFARRMVMSLESPANAIYHLLDHLGLKGPAARLYGRLSKMGSRRRRNKKFWLVPHTRDALNLLSQHFLLAVVTARLAEDAYAFLQQYGLVEFFPVIASAETCHHTKPFPDPLLWAAEKLGVTPQQCVMIGDTLVDIHAGKAAGTQTIGMTCGFGRADELRRAGADLVLQGPEELLKELIPGREMLS